eukprot:1816-Heterococcus_DN1.PRE.2
MAVTTGLHIQLLKVSSLLHDCIIGTTTTTTMLLLLHTKQCLGALLLALLLLLLLLPLKFCHDYCCMLQQHRYVQRRYTHGSILIQDQQLSCPMSA